MILTLLLDGGTTAFFEDLRRRHFPPDRLVVGAHVTLFHALPDDAAPVVDGVLERLAPQPSPVHVAGVRFLGRGGANALGAPPGAQVRAALAHPVAGRLSPQDTQPWRPHVTVQNKVTPARARALHEQLQAVFDPFDATATGVALWHYRGGPWEPARRWAFAP